MPADDALRLDQDKMPPPVAAAQRANHDPEQFVAGAQLRSLASLPGQHRELMGEQEILGHERIAVAHGRTDKAEQQQPVLDHRLNMMRPAAHSSGPTFAPGILIWSAGRLGTGGAESLLVHLAQRRRCEDKAPHLQDQPGRTVSEATEPACTGVTSKVHAFLSQSPAALGDK